MKDINNKLDNISGLVTRIDAKILEINTKLEELIAALHAYDDDLSYEPQHGACSKHDEASWDEIEANKRMDVIGQNGNEGTHYVSNEEADEDAATFNDYGMRVVGKDKSNNSANTNVGEKKRNKRKYYKPKQNSK
jgi:hypothetical protein